MNKDLISVFQDYVTAFATMWIIKLGEIRSRSFDKTLYLESCLKYYENTFFFHSLQFMSVEKQECLFVSYKKINF